MTNNEDGVAIEIDVMFINSITQLHLHQFPTMAQFSLDNSAYSPIAKRSKDKSNYYELDFPLFPSSSNYNLEQGNKLHKNLPKKTLSSNTDYLEHFTLSSRQVMDFHNSDTLYYAGSTHNGTLMLTLVNQKYQFVPNFKILNQPTTPAATVDHQMQNKPVNSLINRQSKTNRLYVAPEVLLKSRLKNKKMEKLENNKYYDSKSLESKSIKNMLINAANSNVIN